MSYFGIDVHVKTSAICEISEEGAVVERCEIPTTQERMRRFFADRTCRGIALEACAQSPWLNRLLIARRCRARSGVSLDGNAGLDEAPSLRALHRPLLRPRRAVTKAETSPSPLLNVGTPPDKRSSANTPIGASPSTSSPVAWAVRDRRVHPAQALPGPQTAAGLGKFRGETAPPGHHPTEDRAPRDALASLHRTPKAADCARTSPTR